jgi:hypothetical protein
MNRFGRHQPLMSAQDFAVLGGSAVAYVRQMRSEEAEFLYPQAQLIPGLTVFVLHAADGTPLAITDSFAEATRDAEGHRLAAMRLH